MKEKVAETKSNTQMVLRYAPASGKLPFAKTTGNFTICGTVMRKYRPGKKKEFISQHKNYLDELPKNAKVCDCSCGNGLQAIALKKERFDVLATDISDEMDRRNNYDKR